MSADTPLRLGTRRSALAWVQSSQVAQALRDAHPGLQIELVGIDTRGDLITNVPLSGIEGKEFFTAEIDAALLQGRVDLTVHSLKDLSLERPPALQLAAIPLRANPRDIILFAADALQQLQAGAGLRIGTASPRRQQLLPAFLQRALPYAAHNTITLEPLRGNVDSRLRRLREPRGSERQLDGVVLALAGLTRLFADTATERQGHALLQQLLQDLPLMVLPLTDVPAAPGQGALAIECRADDARTRGLLSVLEHAATRAAIGAERQVLAQHGGGCHQRFGATQLSTADAGTVMHVAGLAADDRDITARHWSPPATLLPPLTPVRSWHSQDSSTTQALLDAQALQPLLPAARPVFVAHSRAVPADATALLHGKRVWTSGSASWFRLAAQGVWVEGCAEGLGANVAAELINVPVLRLPAPAAWTVLTHAGAEEGWQEGAWSGSTVLATYESAGTALPAADALAAATHVWWSSVSQFERGRAFVSATAHHASGPGKTAAHIRAAGIKHFTPFPSITEWQQWIAKAR